MDPQDKVDLTSVNKTKKQFKLPTLSNPLKKQSAGPGRDQFGQFATGGLKGKSKWMNWKVMTVVVLLVAAIGGFYVYKSNASSYTFVHYASQMQGGQLTTKSNGNSFRAMGCEKNNYIQNICQDPNAETASTLVSKKEMTGTSKVCVHYLGGTGNLTIFFRVGGQVNGSSSRALNNSGSGYLCTTLGTASWYDGLISVTIHNNQDWYGTAQIDTIYGKPGTRAADAVCKASYTQSGTTYTVSWGSTGIDPTEAEPGELPTMHLKNEATGTDTPDLPLSGSRVVSPKPGVNNTYTLTYYEGTKATDLTCSTSINLAPATPPPAATPACTLNISKSGTSYTASWQTTNVPAGSNWGSALSRPGGNTAFAATSGSAGIVPPTGTTTYTLVIFDKNISSTGAMNSWKTTCARSVTK